MITKKRRVRFLKLTVTLPVEISVDDRLDLTGEEVRTQILRHLSDWNDGRYPLDAEMIESSLNAVAQGAARRAISDRIYEAHREQRTKRQINRRNAKIAREEALVSYAVVKLDDAACACVGEEILELER